MFTMGNQVAPHDCQTTEKPAFLWRCASVVVNGDTTVPKASARGAMP
jgi:hypothetical protein